MGVNQVILSFLVAASVLCMLKNSVAMSGKIWFGTTSVPPPQKKTSTAQKWEITTKGAGPPLTSH
jgi:hypothetical protein